MVKNHILKFKFLKLEIIDSSTGDNLDFNLNLNLNFQTEICIICFSLGKTGKTLKKTGIWEFPVFEKSRQFWPRQFRPTPSSIKLVANICISCILKASGHLTGHEVHYFLLT